MHARKQGAQQPNDLFTARRQTKGAGDSARSSRHCWAYGADGHFWSWILELRDKTIHTTIHQNIIFDNTRAVAKVEVEVEEEGGGGCSVSGCVADQRPAMAATNGQCSTETLKAIGEWRSYSEILLCHPCN